MDDLLKRSKEIYDQAVALGRPHAVVLMVSGGDDSLTAAHVARVLGIPVTHLIHGRTGTGIVQTTEFVRQIAPELAPRYLEADAGDAFAERVLSKGFFGIGELAHRYAYHILKSTKFRATVANHIRRRHHKKRVLLINGARTAESKRRARKIPDPVRRDEKTLNFWVNLIHDWEKRDCLDFLADEGVERNPVTLLMHRSGECLCGTMQNQETRREAAFWFPEWGQWLDDLEKEVAARGFPWKWGEPSRRPVPRCGHGDMTLCNSCLTADPTLL